MTQAASHSYRRPRRPAAFYPFFVGLILVAALLQPSIGLGAADSPPASARKSHGFSYLNDRIAEAPWSIHILKIDRAQAELQFHTALAGGSKIGLATMTEQLKALSPSVGKPIAAINGDFWKNDGPNDGDPMGLQIIEGELVSAPCERPAFWIDTNGQPHITNVISLFKVRWPNGDASTLALNEERPDEGTVLYTSAIGPSTHTRRGREFILERDGAAPWLPLRSGQTMAARIREVRETGNAPLSPDTLVLSLSASEANRLPAFVPGSILHLVTDSLPQLRHVQSALGGGPTLIRQGKAVPLSSTQARHPRTALGWNSSSFFFVVVDGRQPGLSVGMTLAELTTYMLQLGCEEAMNLDGGASSTIWVYGQVMNNPSSGHERPMANALIVTRKEKTRSAPILKEGVTSPEESRAVAPATVK